MFTVNRFKTLCRIVCNTREVYWNQFTTIGSIINSGISSCVSRCASHPRSIHQCSIGSFGVIKYKSWKRTPCELSHVLVRHKSHRHKGDRNKSNENKDEDDDESDEEDDFDPELYSDFHDYDAPLDFKRKELHSLRANQVISKGLNLTSSLVENHFYSSKLLLNGTTLLKKGQKLKEGDKLDYIVDKTGNKLSVQRIKVVEIKYRDGDREKPIVNIKVWKKPFEVEADLRR